MPIANCVVSAHCLKNIKPAGKLVDLWAGKSGKPAQQMTLNIIERVQQEGSAYEVMTQLYLPSLWSQDDIELLQLGLADALATYFDIAIGDVQIITHVVESGMVVEDGEVATW